MVTEFMKRTGVSKQSRWGSSQLLKKLNPFTANKFIFNFKVQFPSKTSLSAGLAKRYGKQKGLGSTPTPVSLRMSWLWTLSCDCIPNN